MEYGDQTIGADIARGGYPTVATAGAPGAVDWQRIAQAMQYFGGGFRGFGAGDDRGMLRIGASAAPYNPGGGGLATLLETLIAMHRNAMAGPSSLGGSALPTRSVSLLG